MKRLALILGCWLLAMGILQANTIYVDGSCSTGGSGLDVPVGATCVASSGGPKLTIQAGVDALTNCTTEQCTLYIRGVRAGSSFHGRYGQDRVLLQGRNGAAGLPITIQPFGYAGTKGSGETVYVESTGVGTGATKGWTQCTSCSCQSQTFTEVAGTCTDIWWINNASVGNPGSMNKAIGAQRPDGSPTAHRTTAGALLSQYDSFNSYVDSAPPGTHCNSLQNNSTLFVRWGTTLPSYPAVFFDNNGYGFEIGKDDGTQPSSFIRIEGLNIRGARRALVQINSLSHDVDILNNVLSWSFDATYCESDRAITSYFSWNVRIEGNEITKNRSEPIHTEARAADVAGVYTIKNNWFHHNGTFYMAPNIGAITGGTPQILTLGGGASGAGNYTGSTVEGNLIEYAQVDAAGGANARGITLENDSSGWTIKDNIIRNIEGDCIRLEAQTGAGLPNAASDNVIVNNILENCNTGGADSGGINFKAQAPCFSSNNTVSNNTLVNATIVVGDGAGTMTGNKFINNILYGATSAKLIDWTEPGAASGNIFKNNLLFANGVTCSTQIATILASNFLPGNVGVTNCSGNSWIVTRDVDGDAVADVNKWANPQWTTGDLSSTDYRLHFGSPAIDAGTMTGMPERTGINNTFGGEFCTLNGLRCGGENTCLGTQTQVGLCINFRNLPDYTVPQCTPIAATPDIGAYEFMLQDGGFETGSIDGPWTVPNTAGFVCPYPDSVTPSNLFGLRALAISSGQSYSCYHQTEVCFPSCRAPYIIQELHDLVPGRFYVLTGWFSATGVPAVDSALNFSFYNPADCPTPIAGNGQPNCVLSTCTLMISGGGQLECPSYMVPTTADMNLVIYPVINDAGNNFNVQIDNLELR